MDISKKKLAIIFAGLSYIDVNNTEQISIKGTSYIDYKYCLESYREYLLPSLQSIFGVIDNFIITYNNEKITEIIQDYSPKDMIIIPYCRTASRKENQYQLRMLDSLNLINDYMKNKNQTYDNILLLRFDYVYLQKVPIDKLDLDIINFGWRYEETRHERIYDQTDEGFILLTPHHIDKIIKYVTINPVSHQLQFSFDKYGWISEGIFSTNRYYEIYRIYKQIY